MNSEWSFSFFIDRFTGFMKELDKTVGQKIVNCQQQPVLSHSAQNNSNLSDLNYTVRCK